jgi:hypothetical protein
MEMGKKIEKRGDNVHELHPSDFIGAWSGSCLEKGSAQDQRLSTALRGWCRQGGRV